MIIIKHIIILALTLTGCNTIDDWAIPNFETTNPSEPWTPGPFPVVVAWQPCEQSDTCDDQEGLECFDPLPWDGETYSGLCTWQGCESDEDCDDLSIDEKATPACIFRTEGQGVCQLRCWEYDEECPGDMLCREAGEFVGGVGIVPRKQCVLPGLPVEK